MTGYHCTTDGELWKVPATDFLSNINLQLGQSEVTAPYSTKTTTYACRNWGYFETCTDCNISYYLGIPFFGSYCTTDGYLVAYNRESSTELCNESECYPGTGWYYNISNNALLGADVWTCNNESCANESFESYDNYLKSIDGAQRAYLNASKDYTSLIGVKCSASTPRFTFLGIDIFNYKLWVLIMLIIIILWFWNLTKG